MDRYLFRALAILGELEEDLGIDRVDHKNRPIPHDVAALLATLPAGQRRVAEMLIGSADAPTYPAVAAALSLHVGTVHRHLARIRAPPGRIRRADGGTAPATRPATRARPRARRSAQPALASAPSQPALLSALRALAMATALLSRHNPNQSAIALPLRGRRCRATITRMRVYDLQVNWRDTSYCEATEHQPVCAPTASRLAGTTRRLRHRLSRHPEDGR
jgi:hypothetical protein